MGFLIIVGTIALGVYLIRVARGRFAGTALSKAAPAAAEGIFTGRKSMVSRLGDALLNYLGKKQMRSGYRDAALDALIMDFLHDEALHLKCARLAVVLLDTPQSPPSTAAHLLVPFPQGSESRRGDGRARVCGF